MNKMTEGLTKEEIKLLRELRIRTWVCHMSWTNSRIHGTACGWALYPFINYLYPNPEDKEKKMEALRRETKAYFCMTPQINTLPISIFAAMEKEAAINPDFDPAVIDAVKASIQGPLAGIGDSFFWVTWRTIVTGLCVSLVANSNPIGFILWAVLMILPAMLTRGYFTFAGYKMGTGFISKFFESGLLGIITKAASVVGLIMLGGMVASTVSVPISAVLNFGGAEIAVYDIFNSLIPGLLELALTLFILKLVKEKKNILLIIAIIFAVSILGCAIGLF